MATTAAARSTPAPEIATAEAPLLRLYVLRATYALLVVGVGAMILPPLITHEPAARGVIPSLLGAVWMLAFLGLRYPLEMLPLLMFEFVWKTIWLIDFGLPQTLSGLRPPTYAEDFPAILLGVVLMPFVIPWPYVWRRYVSRKADRWR
jgi:hypothetical protein